MTNVPERGHWLREPLLHFLVIGTGIFLLYSLVRGSNETAPREIVISESRIEALAENFGRTWTRPPTPQELRGLVDDYVKEEVFYREAIAMGLDRDDTVIRRRLRQKMEFVSEDAAASAQPTEAQLQQFLAAHPEKFVEPSRVTFEQVFVNAEKRGDDARRHAERILAELQAGRGPANPSEAGDPTLLPAGSRMHRQKFRSFGDEFGWRRRMRRSINGQGPSLRHSVASVESAQGAPACAQLADIRPWSCVSGDGQAHSSGRLLLLVAAVQI
jgi:hypothetical protein